MGKIVSSFWYSIYMLSEVAQWLLLVRAILSWFPNASASKFSYFLYEITEPLINPVRKLLSRTQLANSMIDFSFLITFMILIIIQDLIVAF